MTQDANNPQHKASMYFCVHQMPVPLLLMAGTRETHVAVFSPSVPAARR